MASVSQVSTPSTDATLASLWGALEPVGRVDWGGYRRFAWTSEDATLREWFAGEAAARGLEVVEDRAGNLWAWWGDPDGPAGPGVVLGSHLDSVPDGGAFDGPLGVVSAFAALDAYRAGGHTPARPVGIACFADEEGARFGVACAGSRLLTGALTPERALALQGDDGATLADALRATGRDPGGLGPDPDALRRVGAFVELHIEQGRDLVELGHPVAVGAGVWPHGRWRVRLPGQANHAGTTRLEDRLDPMLALAALVLELRRAAGRHRALATCGKVRVHPNAVNAIPAEVLAWLDIRAEVDPAVSAVVGEVETLVAAHGGEIREESRTAPTTFPTALVRRLAGLLGEVPVLTTGAGHDAGILAEAGVPAAMLFVRNPTGVSHAPSEHAEWPDCVAGAEALATVLADLAGEGEGAGAGGDGGAGEGGQAGGGDGDRRGQAGGGDGGRP